MAAPPPPRLPEQKLPGSWGVTPTGHRRAAVLRHCLLGCPVPQIRLLTGVGLMELLQDADPAAVAQLLPLVVSLLPQPGDYTNHCPGRPRCWLCAANGSWLSCRGL